MKKALLYISLLLTFSTACSDMNDNFDTYLQDGEDVYVGKFDSLIVRPGDEKIHFLLWSKDPRVKTAVVRWNPGNDSATVTVNPPPQPTELLISPIEEGSYTFSFTTFDSWGNHSVPLEKLAKIYGPKYRALLSNRTLKTTNYDQSEETLDLAFAPPSTEDETGIELDYTNLSGIRKQQYLSNDELDSTVNLTDIDVHKGLSYRSVFLPDPQAIDTFKLDFTPVEIVEIRNVALNRPVAVSDLYAPNFIGPNAVDGIISNDSRWVSAAEGDHWIEIDLGQPCDIFSFKTWIGAGGSFQSPVPQFEFQAYVDGEWTTILEVAGNTDPQFEASFPVATTNKVRYYVPEYENNLVRLYEIAVYARVAVQ